MIPMVKDYLIDSGKLSDQVTALYLTDLHGREYGRHNAELLRLCQSLKPAFILCGGDFVTGRQPETVKPAAAVITGLSEIAPLYFAPGNHESKYHLAGKDNPERQEAWQFFYESLKRAGVVFLANDSRLLSLGKNKFSISGLELPLKAYRKFVRPLFPEKFMKKKLNSSRDVFSILLAHNPYFTPCYQGWGADLALCGHNHGGFMRIGQKTLLSPYGFWLPEYGYGRYDKNGSSVIVSSGLGEHTLPFRVNNPFEIVRLFLR